MTRNTATKPKNAAAKNLPASLLSVFSKLGPGVVNSIGRHHRRAVSLRVHRAVRQDGGIDRAGPAQPARSRGSSPVAASSGGKRTRPNPLARIGNRIRALCAAHAVRLHALRVYDRTRG